MGAAGAAGEVIRPSPAPTRRGAVAHPGFLHGPGEIRPKALAVVVVFGGHGDPTPGLAWPSTGFSAAAESPRRAGYSATRGPTARFYPGDPNQRRRLHSTDSSFANPSDAAQAVAHGSGSRAAS